MPAGPEHGHPSRYPVPRRPGRRPCAARAAPRRGPASARRPGAPAGRPWTAPRRASTRPAARCFPFTWSGATSVTRDRAVHAARGSRSPIRIWPGAACCSSRAATLTASPVTSAWPPAGSPATTSPLLMPVRVASRTSQLALQLVVQLLELLGSSAAARTRPQRVVLERHRDPEHRHRGVADELLDACRRGARRPRTPSRSSAT